MPLYEFYCDTCDCCFQERRSFSQGTDNVSCPSCTGQNVQRVYTPVATFTSSGGGQRVAVGGSSGCAGCAATRCTGCASAGRK